MLKFYICDHCGNIIEKVRDAGVPVMCCGQKMTELVANTVEASAEKHLPVAKVEGTSITVNVGSVDHPMLPEHFIQWVCLETDKGVYRKALQPGQAPNVTFCLGEEKPIAVYEYCNLHGLWMTAL